MRTTITLADDVDVAVREVMRREGVGRSEAVNSLVRAGLAQQRPRSDYRPRTFSMGARIDVTNIGEVLDLLDQWGGTGPGGATGAG
jgi:hypothetical protein